MTEEFLGPLSLTQRELADRMGVPLQRINLLVNGKRGVTAETALLLAEVLGTTPEFWMNLQAQHDLWLAARSLEARRHSVKRLKRNARAAAARSH